MTQASTSFKIQSKFAWAVLLACACAPGPRVPETEAPPAAKVDSTLSIVAHAAQEKPVTAASSESGSPPHCPQYGQPERIGSVVDPQLSEISGLVLGRWMGEPMLWVHNDSGHRPWLTGLSPAGQVMTRTLLDKKLRDWEDIAGYRAADGTQYLYAADTGDNRSVRTDIAIHRFPAPKTKTASLLGVETMPLAYPDGAHDAEALLVDPRSGALALVSKPRMGWPVVYVAASFSQQKTTLIRAAELSPHRTVVPLHFVTAADISPDGRWIGLRTYTGIYLFRRDAQLSIAEALSTPPCSVPAPPEPQGEALGFVNEAQDVPPTIVTISEGVPAKVFRVTPARLPPAGSKGHQ